MKDDIKKILDYLKNNTFIPDETKRKYKILHRDEVSKLLDYITNLQDQIDDLKNRLENAVADSNLRLQENERLNNIINEFDKLLIAHIEEARDELNIILHSDNNLDYKNECAREFDILDKNIRMILNKLKELKENKYDKD